MPPIGNGVSISRCSKCRRYCRIGTTFLFSHIGLCALVVGYSIVGAFTFEALEASHENQKRQVMFRERQKVVNQLWDLTETSKVLFKTNWTLLASVTLQEFEVTLVKAVRKEGYDGKEESPLQWSFSGALLYSIIVITTIGYGNIAPKTPWGKVVTIFYAIIGIPLLLLCLSNIGDAMAHSFKFIYWKVCCYLCVRPKKRRKKMKIYKPPTFRPSEAIRGPPESPQGSRLGSSSSYHTAPATSGEASSPSASSVVCSPVSSPQSSPPPFPFPLHCDHPHVPSRVSNSQQKSNRHPFTPFQDKRIDISLVPIISNKYVLQDDKPIDISLPGKDKASTPPTSRVFNVMAKKNYQFPRKPPPHLLNSSQRYPWNEVCQDTDVTLTDEESVGTTPEPDEEVQVPMWLCLALVVSYICGGAVLFTFWEKWNFLDSSYFCFVTLTTIGFGDLVPGTAVISDDNQMTLGLCSLYLLFGMALLAMSFNLVQEEVTKSVKCVGRRIGIISDDEDD